MLPSFLQCCFHAFQVARHISTPAVYHCFCTETGIFWKGCEAADIIPKQMVGFVVLALNPCAQASPGQLTTRRSTSDNMLCLSAYLSVLAALKQCRHVMAALVRHSNRHISRQSSCVSTFCRWDNCSTSRGERTPSIVATHRWHLRNTRLVNLHSHSSTSGQRTAPFQQMVLPVQSFFSFCSTVA